MRWAMRFLVPIAALLVAGDGSADSMHCGEKLIERGFTFFEVLERCGKPDLEYAWEKHYAADVETRVTEWVYEQGNNRFRRVLTFEEGRLRNIELRSKPEASLDSLR